ncbi:hypothetical protein BH10PLA1_BH10PLA1_04690 [soil metagenome]
MPGQFFEILEQRQLLSASVMDAEFAGVHPSARFATFAPREAGSHTAHSARRSHWHGEDAGQGSGEHQHHGDDDAGEQDDDGGGVGAGTTTANQAPGFTPGADQTVTQDSGQTTIGNWATNISAGPASESSQSLTFNTSTNNDALFAVKPAIGVGGTLTFTPAAGATGSATVTVFLQDSGGTANGGVDTSPSTTFLITVDPATSDVNQAPSFTEGPNQTVPQDAGVETIANWATNISAGPASEAGQSLTFLTSTSNDALFATKPSIAANGTLTYATAAGATGSATVTVMLKDSGGTANGGVDTSTAQTFTIDVTTGTPVVINQAPSFTAGANQSVAQDSGAKTVSKWASNISAGPASEASQTLTFSTSTSNDALFSTKPAISADGTLTYTPASGKSGSATVTVLLKDSGGTANGGVDTSAAKTFTITVNAPVATIPSLVGTYNGQLVIPAVGHNKTAVLKITSQAADGSYTGTMTSSSVSVVISGKVAANGTFTMSLDIPPGTPHSGGSLSGTGTGSVVAAGVPMLITLSFSGIPGTLTVTKA